jgi:hypothetical protein
MSTRAEVLKERAAFIAGATAWGANRANAQDAARFRYPLPKLKKPRVVESNKIFFSLVDGKLLHMWSPSPAKPHWNTAETIADPSSIGGVGSDSHKRLIAGALEAYAELKANPTELVEDDA